MLLPGNNCRVSTGSRVLMDKIFAIWPLKKILPTCSLNIHLSFAVLTAESHWSLFPSQRGDWQQHFGKPQSSGGWVQSWAQPGMLTGEASSLLSLTMCELLTPHALSQPQFENGLLPRWTVVPSSCLSLTCPSWAGSIALPGPWLSHGTHCCPEILQVGCCRGLNMGMSWQVHSAFVPPGPIEPTPPSLHVTFFLLTLLVMPWGLSYAGFTKEPVPTEILGTPIGTWCGYKGF